MTSSEQSKKKKIIVVGAGPAGLLSCILLLRRTNKYEVTLIDPGVDYGKLDEDGLARFRSWMIGLTCHGLHAIQQVHGLFEDYVEGLGISISSQTLTFGNYFKTTITLDEDTKASIGFVVDRNYICAALAKYLNDKFESSSKQGNKNDASYIPYYNTKALYVDTEKQQLMVRSVNSDSTLPKKDTMVPLEYDYLIGCDGIRSIVRNAFITNHRDFEFDLTDSGGKFKAVHMPLPDEISEGSFFILIQCLPNIASFTLPERGRMMNMNLGWSNHKPCDPELLSDDPQVIKDYMKKHFKIWDMDLDEFSKQLVKQSIGTLQMVHCNFYHSLKLNALLMGDAAHATVPNIGQGMNTALADAFVLDELLDKYSDDWEQVLPAFSEERVKEGNALTELSHHTFSMDPGMQLEIMVRQISRSVLNKIFPEWMVEKEPMGQIPLARKKLSWAYDKVTKYGYLPKSRRINQEIKRKHFEKITGMVIEEPNRSLLDSVEYWLWVVLVVVVSYAVGRGIWV